MTALRIILCSFALLCLPAQAQETVTLPVDGALTVRMPLTPDTSREIRRLTKRIDELERQQAKLAEENAALRKQVAAHEVELASLWARVEELVKQLAALRVAVLLEFVDESGAPLAGVPIEWIEDGKTVASLITDKNGQSQWELTTK